MPHLLKLIGVSLGSLIAGYFLGSHLTPVQPKFTKNDLVEEEFDDDSEEEDEEYEVDSRALNEIPGECKMVLVVRTDLQMGKGKAAAQCCHAAVALYRMMLRGETAQNLQLLNRWESLGQAKITLKCDNQEDMDMLYAQLISMNINSYIVHDAGRTQIEAGSATVLGLGPAPLVVLNQVTGGLKLY